MTVAFVTHIHIHAHIHTPTHEYIRLSSAALTYTITDACGRVVAVAVVKRQTGKYWQFVGVYCAVVVWQ